MFCSRKTGSRRAPAASSSGRTATPPRGSPTPASHNRGGGGAQPRRRRRRARGRGQVGRGQSDTGRRRLFLCKGASIYIYIYWLNVLQAYETVKGAIREHFDTLREALECRHCSTLTRSLGSRSCIHTNDLGPGALWSPVFVTETADL
ncbi:hypothetical protein Pelo_12389 [Pelomyxa schiedti]|nr:hypothetical protein Pelo_12389 [Pelomyxa schiedti]